MLNFRNFLQQYVEPRHWGLATSSLHSHSAAVAGIISYAYTSNREF